MRSTQSPLWGGYGLLGAGILFSVGILLNGGLADSASAAEFDAREIEFFESDIRPLLVHHCLKCHGDDPKKIRGGLRLTSRAEILKGGESGPAAVAGKPTESLIISAVHYEDFEMPPKGKLPEKAIAKLERWVEMGLPDPRIREADVVAANREIDIEAGRAFWAFQPREPLGSAAFSKIEKAAENSTHADWSRSRIDDFILAKLDSVGIAPNADANRTVLIRRAYFALIGLSPTPEQIDDFVNNTASLSDAYGRVIDELLQSPHFGERWGRHWLDVARFAESSGGGRSLMFPQAWRYRDYVIAAYNADKPFDQFVREQIAGDLLPADNDEQRSEHLTAAGLLVLGPINYEQQNKSLLRMEVVDEQVDTVGRAFLAMTLGCARCHDHKFDPIPTADYYAMAGIFGATQSLVDGNVSNPVMQKLPLPRSEQQALDAFTEELKALTEKVKVADAKVKKLTGVEHTENLSEKSIDVKRLAGIVIDNRDAEVIGDWTSSTQIARFVNQEYIHNSEKPPAERRVVFSPKFQVGGKYEVRLAYSAGGNRASNVPVTILHQDGQDSVMVNQSQRPPIDGLFLSLGTFRFEADNVASVTVGTAGANGVVIVDAVQFLPANESDNEKVASSIVKDVAAVSAKGQNEKKDLSQRTQAANRQRAAELAQAETELAAFNKQLVDLKKNAPPAAPKVMSVKEAASPSDGHIHIRGSFDNLGPVVPRGYLTVACEPGANTPTIDEKESGRLQLANWIASPDNPLTARVYVNRVWRHLFGVGLVATPDNFGAMGERPSHPELLDYLAQQFIADGWSTKKLIRRIMLSRVYWLDSKDSSADESRAQSVAQSVDGENRLLWRANRRRLDAEVIRDTILQASGSLDLAPGGLTIRKIATYDLGYEFDTVRRSVYIPAFRNSLMPLLEVFDVANPNLVTGHRKTTTLATQALFMMNSPMVVGESRKLAQRLLDEEFANDEERIQTAYRRLLGRAPTLDESRLAAKYLSTFQADDASLDDRIEAWSSFCHGLFACVDFRYME